MGIQKNYSQAKGVVRQNSGIDNKEDIPSEFEHFTSSLGDQIDEAVEITKSIQHKPIIPNKGIEGFQKSILDQQKVRVDYITEMARDKQLGVDWWTGLKGQQQQLQ